MNWVKTSDRLPPPNKTVLCWWGGTPELLTTDNFPRFVKYWAEIEPPEPAWSPYDHPFWCRTCGNTFDRAETLAGHRMRKHTITKHYK